ncbi:uncharacterized protein [Diadema setosum]|uniref:uncharacterized protein n=1 Tax=Diadema setosum TaxID=31175 RepID=UPI003B3B8B60
MKAAKENWIEAQCKVIDKGLTAGNIKEAYNTLKTLTKTSQPKSTFIDDKDADELLAEEQAGFRAGRSTVEQIFNCRVLIEKHLQHQRDVFHNFIDFKTAFDRVWHDGLWMIMRDFGIDKQLVQVIQALYANSSSAVLLNGQLGEFFKTTVASCRKHYRTTILQSQLVVDPSVIFDRRRHRPHGGHQQRLQDLTNRLVDRAEAYGMDVSTVKSKVMVNSPNNISANITMNRETLDEVTNFKYLGSNIYKDDTCTGEIRTRIATATAAMARLNKLWKGNISFNTKYMLFRSPSPPFSSVAARLGQC